MLISFFLSLVFVVLLAIKKELIYAILMSSMYAITIVCSVIYNVRNKKNRIIIKRNKNMSKPKPYSIDALIEAIKNKTEMDNYEMVLQKADDIDIFASKIGGLPYWDLSMEYPTDPDGNKLVLLAQINFEKEQFNDDRLPNYGLLQLFVKADDVYGMNFDNEAEQKNWRGIFHKDIKKEVRKEDITKLGIPTTSTIDSKTECFPFYGEYLIEFKKTKTYIEACDYNFDVIVKEVLKESFNEEVAGPLFKYFTNEESDALYEKFNEFGHKLLGHPAFTQNDPRGYEITQDTLLLQIDSKDGIMWGDSGICNFFINREDLKNADFSNLLYNWDCY